MKLKVNYHVDKLILVYQIPETFMAYVVSSISMPQFLMTSSDKVFIFSPKYMAVNYTCPIYIVERINENGENVKIAEFRNDIHQAITVTVDNKLFYSDNLNLLYEFEAMYNLEFQNIIKLDVACDSNLNLPKKLNDFLHRPDCTIKRMGTKLPTTPKGNQIVGTKIMQNIKMTNGREQAKPSFYYQLKTSGSRNPIIYRGYNKTQEISEKSHKTYIEEANEYGDIIYRFEVSILGRDLKQRSKKDPTLSHDFVYRHLIYMDFLKELFIKYINRIVNLWIGKTRYRVSEILRLE